MNKRDSSSPFNSTVILWVLIAVYTFLLPQVRIVYQASVNYLGEEATGKIPLISVLVFGFAYTAYGLATKRGLKSLLYLIPSGAIAYAIIRLEPNPNKHIHIPEYVVMAWLLFSALSKDYQGKGVYLLIFLAGSMLGVVDELEQGLHPRRFYGWSDMIVNSASVVIGIFTLMGLKEAPTGDWSWAKNVKKHSGLVALILFGIFGATLMGVNLFQVQAQEAFLGVYPPWLIGWNALYVVLTPISIFLTRRRNRERRELEKAGNKPHEAGKPSTVKMWVYPLLGILFYIHAIAVYLALSGAEFR